LWARIFFSPDRRELVEVRNVRAHELPSCPKDSRCLEGQPRLRVLSGVQRGMERPQCVGVSPFHVSPPKDRSSAVADAGSSAVLQPRAGGTAKLICTMRPADQPNSPSGSGPGRGSAALIGRTGQDRDPSPDLDSPSRGESKLLQLPDRRPRL